MIYFQLKKNRMPWPNRGATIGTKIKILIINELMLANLFPLNKSRHIACETTLGPPIPKP